ncbi:uncharacterized protein LOC114916483 [Cajanus cajan]|uniref:uncharacterized protein LOC114916483 n=1 Tax=Cajanus cajan TaxID=3821 RepID=UPI0010FB04A0|nr:uncharacterized protein LOC114916483 [Cajanus cajan]
MAARVERKPLKAPKNLLDAVFMLADAMKHADHMEGKKTVARECGERSDCVQLKAPEILQMLHELKTLLTRTMLFTTKKGFAAFDEEDVLLRKTTARILRPAFIVIRDEKSKSLIVFIRGTRSLRDMLTDALCAPLSFEHIIYSHGSEQSGNKKVSGHAHRGMVAAALWVKNRCIPVLLDALQLHPDFKIKIVGHPLGGGIAALLTYKLREIQQFSSSTCVTFGPGM